MSLASRYSELRKIVELSSSLAKAKFKLRNEGSYLGIFWYLLEPLSTFGILLLLGKALSQNVIEKYPLYLLWGLILFNFLMAVTNSSIKAIVANGEFIKSMKISQETFVLSTLIQYVYSHVFEIIILMGLSVYLNVSLAGFLIYPAIFILFCFFILGCSFILATVGVYIRDLSNVWPICARLLWFATPIFYATEDKQHLLYIFNLFNPLAYFISLARDVVVYNTVPSAVTMGVVGVMSISVFCIGLWTFECHKAKFAERL